MTGLGRTALQINAAAVNQGIITQAEGAAVMDLFKKNTLGSIDPCSLGRVRACTLLPVATVATVARTFGHSTASMALLRALAQPIPEAWALEDQRLALEEQGEVDYVLEQQLEEHGFEAEVRSCTCALPLSLSLSRRCSFAGPHIRGGAHHDGTVCR